MYTREMYMLDDQTKQILRKIIIEEYNKLREAPGGVTQVGSIPGNVGTPRFDTPDVGAPTDERTLQRAKVRLFFDRLKKNPTLMGYLNFTSPVEQVQAIVQFAEMVGVPKSQLVNLLTGIKRVSTK